MADIFKGDTPNTSQIFEEACVAAELGHHDEAMRLLAIAATAIWLSDESNPKQ